MKVDESNIQDNKKPGVTSHRSGIIIFNRWDCPRHERSPIIQNGKLIGAVTHVFVQDSAKGYGIFIEKNAGALNVCMSVYGYSNIVNCVKIVLFLRGKEQNCYKRSMVTIQQLCVHAALTVRTHRLESKNTW